jgi:hypothetical protein
MLDDVVQLDPQDEALKMKEYLDKVVEFQRQKHGGA